MNCRLPPFRRGLFALAIGALLSVSAPAKAIEFDKMEDWETKVTQVVAENLERASGEGDPLAAPMELCQGTACFNTSMISLEPHEIAALRALLSSPAATAADERALLGRAIALYEVFVGAKNGTWRDRPGNLRGPEGEAGQMDCISEANNAKTYLDRLQAAGLISHHRVGTFVRRYTLFLQHIAVEMVEAASNARWVVDSWVGANGEEPSIELYDLWRKEYSV